MSEHELDKILNEIRTRGNTESSNAPTSDDELKSAVENFSSRSTKSVEPEPAAEPFNIVEEIAPPAPSIEDIAPPKKKIEEPDLDLFNINTPTEPKAVFDDSDNYQEMPEKKKSKKPLIAIVAVILVIAIGLGLYFGVFAKNKDDSTKPTTTKAQTTATADAPVVTDVTTNPLTGEPDYDQAALTQRPIAVVVENEYSTAGVRPQWGIDQADIVLEGEAEFATRTLLFWADYTKAPSKIGPTRSARPPFIRFSQLFDSVFIHAGLSRSKGNYVGADTVFKNEGVDHINLLSYETDGVFIGRDSSRTSVIEHTGYFNGSNAAKLLETAKINTTLNENKFTRLKFNTDIADIGTEDGSFAHFKWSSNCPDYIDVEFDEDSKTYSTAHFDSSSSGEVSNCKWTNCIFLFDTTEYIVKNDYKGVGNSETYCDYKLSGGKGYVLSNGKSVAITWGVENGKLWLKKADTNEDIVLNPGKSYIGYGSSNNGGSLTFTKE